MFENHAPHKTLLDHFHHEKTFPKRHQNYCKIHRQEMPQTSPPAPRPIPPCECQTSVAPILRSSVASILRLSPSHDDSNSRGDFRFQRRWSAWAAGGFGGTFPRGAPKCRGVAFPRLTLAARSHIPDAGGPGVLRTEASIPVTVVAGYVVGDTSENAPGPAVRAPSDPSVPGDTAEITEIGQPGRSWPGWATAA